MNRLFSTITSKGQVTIPKTARDFLGLEEKTQVEFIIKQKENGDKLLTIEKIEDDAQQAIAMELLRVLMEDNHIIGFGGIVGSGKTRLIMELLKRHFLYRQVFFYQEDRCYRDLENSSITTISHIQELPNIIDLLILDEASHTLGQLSYEHPDLTWFYNWLHERHCPVLVASQMDTRSGELGQQFIKRTNVPIQFFVAVEENAIVSISQIKNEQDIPIFLKS